MEKHFLNPLDPLLLRLSQAIRLDPVVTMNAMLCLSLSRSFSLSLPPPPPLPSVATTTTTTSKSIFHYYEDGGNHMATFVQDYINDADLSARLADLFKVTPSSLHRPAHGARRVTHASVQPRPPATGTLGQPDTTVCTFYWPSRLRAACLATSFPRDRECQRHSTKEGGALVRPAARSARGTYHCPCRRFRQPAQAQQHPLDCAIVLATAHRNQPKLKVLLTVFVLVVLSSRKRNPPGSSPSGCSIGLLTTISAYHRYSYCCCRRRRYNYL